MLYKRNQELRLKPTYETHVKWATQHDVLSVVWVNPKLGRAAIANMSNVFGLDVDGKTLAKKGKRKKAHQIPKPKVYSFDEIDRMFSCVRVGQGIKFFRLPKVLREPDQVIPSERLVKWQEKNDKALEKLSGLVDPNVIESYLLGHGIADELNDALTKLAMANPMSTCSSPTALIRHLNQYITFSGAVMPLLPLGYLNCGSNYLHNTDKMIIKRGAGGKDGRNATTDYKAITSSHKKLIKRLSRQFGTSNRNGALRYTEMHYVYCIEALEAEGIDMPEQDEHGNRDLSKFEPYILSYGAFRHHYLNELSLTERLFLRYGTIRVQRDFLDRQGHAIDMNLGANDVVEIDSTELSLHVRDPRVGEKRMSAGRLFLCIAVCVRTRYILGYSLSFKPPCWENVAECLYNILEDKKEFCERFGIHLKDYQWVSHHLFDSIQVDNGIEYPVNELDELVASQFGCAHVKTVTKGRGDLKPIVERLIGYFDSMVATLEGGIEADRDQTEQDASQRALHSIEDVHRKIIREIITENLRKDCADLMDSDMAQQNIGISPHSLWTYSMENQMGGGHPIDVSELPAYRYMLLPKAIVKVKQDGIHFNGLLFHCEYAKKKDWYIKAKYLGEVEMRMAYTPSLCDALFYEDDEGTIHTFELADQKEQYSGLSWEEVKERQAYVAELRSSNKRQKLSDKVANAMEDRKDRRAAEKAAKGSPKNDQSGYQKGTNDRRRELAADLSKDKAQSVHDQLTNSTDSPVSPFSEEDAI